MLVVDLIKVDITVPVDHAFATIKMVETMVVLDLTMVILLQTGD